MMDFKTFGAHFGIETEKEWDELADKQLARFNELLNDYVGHIGGYVLDPVKLAENTFGLPGLTDEECLEKIIKEEFFARQESEDDEHWDEKHRTQAFWFDMLAQNPKMTAFRLGWGESYRQATEGIAELEKAIPEMVQLRDAALAEYGADLRLLHVEILEDEISDKDYDRMVGYLDRQPLALIYKHTEGQKSTRLPPFFSNTRDV